MPRRTAALLDGAGLRPGSRIVDLGCGKGTFALALARRFGWRVLGVDAFGPFVEGARRAARRAGLDHLCEFSVGDLRRFRAPRRFDAACMLGIDPLPAAARRLRALVRPGGVYVVDDAVRESGTDEPGLTLAQARGLIKRLGDALVVEDVPARGAINALNRRLYVRLSARAQELGRREPHLRGALRDFLHRQRNANLVLAGPLRPAVWVIRRGRRRSP